MDLVGTVLIPAAFGGLAGTVVSVAAQFVLEERNSKNRFKAAALLVRDELHANIVRLKIAVEGSEVPDGLESQTYQDVQLLLAQRLPKDALSRVRKAYIHIRAPRALEARWTKFGPPYVRQEPAGVEPMVENIKAALSDAEAAHAALAPHVPKAAEDFAPG